MNSNNHHKATISPLEFIQSDNDTVEFPVEEAFYPVVEEQEPPKEVSLDIPTVIAIGRHKGEHVLRTLSPLVHVLVRVLVYVLVCSLVLVLVLSIGLVCLILSEVVMSVVRCPIGQGMSRHGQTRASDMSDKGHVQSGHKTINIQINPNIHVQ